MAEITAHFERVIEMLSKDYPAAPQIEAPEEQFSIHKSYKLQDLMPRLEITLKGQENPVEALDNFIMKRAEEALLHKDRFDSMMKQIS